jgi:hypothetical protein
MLFYLVKHSRPDISNAVRELSKVADVPRSTLECFIKDYQVYFTHRELLSEAQTSQL